MTFSITTTVRRQIVRAGEAGCFLLVCPKDPGLSAAELEDEVRGAVTSANAAVPARTVIGGYVTTTPRGIAVSVLSDRSHVDASHEWLQALGEALASTGLTGVVRPSHRPPNIDELVMKPLTYPAALVGYRLNDWTPTQEPFRGWQVDANTAAQVARSLQELGQRLEGWEPWARFPYGWVPLPSDGPAEFLTSSAAWSSTSMQVLHLRKDRNVAASTILNSLGQCVTQTIDPMSDWQALLDTQIDYLLIAPQAADVGMIKNLGPEPYNWRDADLRWGAADLHRTVRLPHDYIRNRHLWDEYVIDAAGVNLLTDKHLTHAHDLSDWTIEEVAPNRYLVKANDLAAWYSGLAADKATINKARADFGDMILTWDHILANPGPYTITGNIVGR